MARLTLLPHVVSLWWDLFAARRQLAAARMRLQRVGSERDASLGLLFGFRSIARFMGVSRNQARALARRGSIPVFVLDGVPCARRSVLVDHIVQLEQGALPTREVNNGERS